MRFCTSLLYGAAVFFLFTWCANADCSDGDGVNSSTLFLKKQLFCGYDKHIQPVKEHTSITNVNFQFFLLKIEFYEFYNILQVNGIIRVNWVDENLRWNTTEHENVDYKMTVSAESLWIPDLSDIEDSGHLIGGDTPCTIYSNGEVLCESDTIQSVTCFSNLRRWPFDQHTCKMIIQNWSKTQNLNMTIRGERGLFNHLYEPSAVWELLNSSVTRREFVNSHKVTVSRLTYTFILRRHSGEGVSGVVVPAVALASLTCLTFLLRSRSTERLVIICVNIMSHCLYLLHMSFRVPNNGDVTPLIVLFYRDSLLMAALSLIITIFVRKMDAISSSPPACVAGVVNGVLATRLGQTLLLIGDEPSEKNIADSGKNEDTVGPNRWRLGAVIDSLSFCVCVVVTIVLMTKFVPESVNLE